jgi:hypothetical protein
VPSVCEFREKRCGESRAVPAGVTTFQSTLFHDCFPVWEKFGIRDAIEVLLSSCDFCGLRRWSKRVVVVVVVEVVVVVVMDVNGIICTTENRIF